MKTKILFSLLTTLLLASCGPKQQAKDTVKAFVKASIGSVGEGSPLAYSFKDFGHLDSTRYVTDSIIGVMQANAKRDSHFQSAPAYGQRKPKEQLKYITAKMSVDHQDTTYTFYLTNDLTQVVAFK